MSKQPTLQEGACLQVGGQGSDLTEVREVRHPKAAKVCGEKHLLLLGGSEGGVSGKFTELKHKLTEALNVRTKNVRRSNACVKVKLVSKDPQCHGDDGLLDWAG